MAAKEKRKVDERSIRDAMRKHTELSKSGERSTLLKDHVFRNLQEQQKKRGEN